jgi:DNA-binding NarL/FixJ family response regulator
MPSHTDPPRIRVALVEDDLHFQHAIVSAIAGSTDIQLIGIAGTCEKGLQMLAGSPADVLLVDLGLPDGSGIDVIQAAQVRWPRCAVMVNTTFGDEAHVLRSIEAGASGYLLKDSAAATMLQEIRSLHAGGSPISPLIARQILRRFHPGGASAPPAPVRPADPILAAPPGANKSTSSATGQDTQAQLSAREKEVLELITKGFTADEIARLMAVSVHTVQTYIRRIYSKLNVHSKVEAIYEARNQGLLRT